MSSLAASFITMLEYRDARTSPSAPEELLPEAPSVVSVPAELPAMVTEDEVEERVARARAEAKAEAEQLCRAELEKEREEVRRSFERSLQAFSAERVTYFKSVETELVQLALAIVRKILEREAQLDPALLAALVRIALDRMRGEGAVTLRVPPSEAELWRGMQAPGAQNIDWIIEPDESLSPGDCVLETDVGTANFGLEAQVQSIEQSLLELMAQRRERA